MAPESMRRGGGSVARSYSPSSPSSSSTDASRARLPRDDVPGSRKRKRTANVYDAVAGRVTTTGALDPEDSSEALLQRRQHASLRDPTLAPEEVLFRRVGAPIRYAEKDIYHAHDRLSEDRQAILPDSDMLKAIHNYSGHFFSALAAADPQPDRRARRPHRSIDERSMDETALLAFGILLEEAGRGLLGKRGDLVLTEGVEAEPTAQGNPLAGEAVGFLDVDMPRPRFN